MQKYIIYSGIFILIALGIGILASNRQQPVIAPTAAPTASGNSASSQPTLSITSPLTAVPSSTIQGTRDFIEPVAEFQKRITKLPFGIFVTPQNSPIQPMRFQGFHTGVDVEYEEVAEEVPVVAIADGVVAVSREADGYGGVVGIHHIRNGKTILAIYGHLDTKSMVKLGSTVTQGQQIGTLGDHRTPETDGERKHLHFDVYTGSGINIRGYVDSKAELSNWLDPLELYSMNK